MGAAARGAMTLTAGRTFGFAVAFAIPLVLARVFTQDEFGIYKFLFLLSTTMAVAQLGMAESLYYFVPRGEAPGRFVANALAVLAVLAGICVALFTFAGGAIARLSGNAAVAPFLPPLGWFIGLTLIALPLEIVMVARHRYHLAAVTYAGSDLLRAAALIVPVLVFRDLYALLLGAIVFASVRVLVLAVYLRRDLGASLRFDPKLLAIQCAYALPFAAAVILEVTQVNLHQYVVWARFDPALFAIYAAGCLQIPLVDLLSTSVANVMMVRMSARRITGAAALATWSEVVERLAFVYVPLVVALVLVADDVIAVLFTSAYAASVPIFAISTTAILLAALPVDAVLRVYAQTRFLIWMNVVRLGAVAAAIVPAMALLGLRGAILATVASAALAKLVALHRIARLFDATWRTLLPWPALARTAAAAAIAALPAWWLHGHVALPAIPRASLTVSAFGVIYLTVTAAATPALRGTVARHLGWQGSR